MMLTARKGFSDMAQSKAEREAAQAALFQRLGLERVAGKINIGAWQFPTAASNGMLNIPAGSVTGQIRNWFTGAKK